MTPEEALAALKAEATPERAERAAARHGTARETLGVSLPRIEGLVRGWRADGESIEARLDLARGLWASEAFEARLAAAKLLAQARIRGDESVWKTVKAWVPQIDCAAIGDAVAEAGRRRVAARPERLDEVEAWISDPDPWTRRAAMGFVRPWARGRHPDEAGLAVRERVLGWAAELAGAEERAVQRAVADWLRALSKHDPERVRAFLDQHGARLRPAARRHAAARLDAPARRGAGGAAGAPASASAEEDGGAG